MADHPNQDVEMLLERHPWVFSTFIVILGVLLLYGMWAYAEHIVHRGA